MELLAKQIKACTTCADFLPFDPKPVFSMHRSSKVMIVGQAPGTAVHKSGIPWDDPSGKRLREWMGVTDDEFYDERLFAIIPMGFCYPGKGKSGDLPPRKECAPQWHERMTDLMPTLKLKILIGAYAQKYYIPRNKYKNLTQTVMHVEDFLPDLFPLVHPSPRNNIWLAKNPWMEKEIVPLLKLAVRRALND